MKISNNSGCNCGCGIASAVLGIVTGIVVAVLFSMGLTPLLVNGIWVALGIAGIALVYILVSVAVNSCRGSCNVLEKCLIKNLKCLLIGIFGTLLTALTLIIITLETTSIVVTIIVGLATFFLIFLIASIISFLKCLVYRV